MADRVALLAPHLDGALVPPATLARMAAATRRLPPLSGAILECRLDGAPGLDLSVRARVDDGGRALLAGRPLPSGPVWRRIARFATLWRDERSPLNRAVENVWLELDDPGAGGAQPAPCFFFDVRGAAPAEVREVAAAGLSILAGKVFSRAARKRLEELLQRLPPGAAAYYFGALLPRTPRALRFCPRVPIGALAGYLVAIGGIGAREERCREIANVVQEIAGPGVFEVVLSLDVETTASIGAVGAIGVEVKPACEAGWPGLLARLVAGGLGSPARRDALALWTELSAAAAPGGPSIVRRFNHVKLVFGPRPRPAAKVYLYAGFGCPNPGKFQ
jgi:hypothetical protein